MKKEVSPAVVVIVLVAALLVLGGWFYLSQRSPDGKVPNAGVNAGPMVGGKRLPSAAPSGGGNAPSGGGNAPSGGGNTARQGTEQPE